MGIPTYYDGTILPILSDESRSLLMQRFRSMSETSVSAREGLDEIEAHNADSMAEVTASREHNRFVTIRDRFIGAVALVGGGMWGVIHDSGLGVGVALIGIGYSLARENINYSREERDNNRLIGRMLNRGDQLIIDVEGARIRERWAELKSMGLPASAADAQMRQEEYDAAHPPAPPTLSELLEADLQAHELRKLAQQENLPAPE